MTGQTLKLDDYFEGCLYFSLSKLQRNINKLAEDSFAQVGLAPSQAFLLMALNEHEKLSAGELSELLGLAPSTITRFVDKLEKQKLCIRKVEGRASFASITSEGETLIPDILASWKSLFHSYNKIYGKEKAGTLNDMVAALNNSVD